jgi:DNA polymerase-3 subunit epsilon
MRQIFLDTETTGLSPESGDRIIEIGCVEMVNRRLTGQTKHFYVNPQRPNSEDAVKVHGLSDEFLADKPLFGAVADEFLRFVAGAELIIHNASFDVGFLDMELRRLGQPGIASCVTEITDSLAMARDAWPGKSNSLDALCRRLEVDNSSRALHGALLDAGLLAEVYVRMTRGQESLVIDVGDGPEREAMPAVFDFSVFEFIIVAADEEELAAHEALLLDLDKASGRPALWRNAVP